MKKALFTVLLLLVATLSFEANAISAQEQSQNPPSEQGAQEAPQMIDVTIMQVDTAGSSVTVETTDKRKGTLKVDATTKITISGKKARLSDLKEGLQAKIAFNRQGVALSIDA